MNSHNTNKGTKQAHLVVTYQPGEPIDLENIGNDLERTYQVIREKVTLKYLYDKVSQQVPAETVALHQMVKRLQFTVKPYHMGPKKYLRHWDEYHSFSLILGQGQNQEHAQEHTQEQPQVQIDDDVQGNILVTIQGQPQRLTLMHKTEGYDSDSETDYDSDDETIYPTSKNVEFNYQALYLIRETLQLHNLPLSRILNYIICYYQAGRYHVADPILEEYDTKEIVNFSALYLKRHPAYENYQRYLETKKHYQQFDEYLAEHEDNPVAPWEHMEENYPWHISESESEAEVGKNQCHNSSDESNELEHSIDSDESITINLVN